MREQVVEFDLSLINETFEPLLEDRKRYLLAYGGAGSGKSYFAAQKILLRVLSTPKHRILLLRNTKRTIRQSQFKLLKSMISGYNLEKLFRFNETDMSITCMNGSEIISEGLDDTEKLKSIAGITSIWIEEATEVEEIDFDQVDLRLRGECPDYRQIILTFNPIDENHWIRSRFFLGESPANPETTTIHHSVYSANEFIDEDYQTVVEAHRKRDPSYWNVYGLGKWGTLKLGHIFTREHYKEWEILPPDLKTVLYCDPNLSKKGKGDTTAITEIGFSPSTDMYYIASAACRSFSDSNNLLDTVLDMRSSRTKALGFDGNVTQESTWTNNVRNWSKINGQAFPVIEFKRYKVDDLTKNVQLVFAEDRILFPPGFRDTPEGKNYITQVFAFEGKSAGETDDAPDSLICAFEFLHERRSLLRTNRKPFYRVEVESAETY